MWPWSKKLPVVTMTRAEVLDLLPTAEYYELLKESYILPSDQEVLDVLGRDNSTYDHDINDCNDYAYRAKGLVAGRGWPFAVVWIRGTVNPKHSINLYVNRDKKVVLLEPQTRMVYADVIQKFHSILI